jgi:hypothetical protein
MAKANKVTAQPNKEEGKMNEGKMNEGKMSGGKMNVCIYCAHENSDECGGKEDSPSCNSCWNFKASEKAKTDNPGFTFPSGSDFGRYHLWLPPIVK